MARGKYAKKHYRELENNVNNNMASPLLVDFFDDSYSFVDKFKALNIDSQVEIVRLLHNIIKKEEQSPSSGRGRLYAEEARYLLGNIHKLTGCSYDQNNFYPLAKDEKRLIRMECYGTINRRKDDELSFLFKYFRKKAIPNKFDTTAYHLLASPSWKVFHQFESFRSIEPKIRRYLHKSGIHPDALQVMTVSDICEVIFQTFKKNDNDIVANFLPKSESIRSKQNKAIMKYAGKEFENLLMKRTVDGEKIDERVVKSYCDMMRRYGKDDINSLIVTERYYNKRILDNLASADLNGSGIDVSMLNEGTPIAQEFIDYLIDTGKADLIIALDAEGNPLSKKGLPVKQYHHNHSVMLASKEDTIAATNYPNNGVDVDVRIHQGYMHLFDKVLHLNGEIEQIAARLNIQNKNMRVMLGFDVSKDAIYCDLENNREFRKRKAKDLKCKVNYFDMMQKRLQNEAKIIKKHNIECPRSYVHEGYRCLKEIKNTEDYNKEAMREVEKLLKAQYISRKKGRDK
ncbi:MAG: hypothetical protein IJ677_05415 [Alphaproteobacteria bacterium]|nr:hypothetical protein [Alphaproteobacteria bacterium]